MNANDIPRFSNINVRGEFLELQRRVLLPEGLVEFFTCVEKSNLPGRLREKLKSLRTRKKKANDSNMAFKITDQEIKEFRRLFSDPEMQSGETAWTQFCEEYLAPYLRSAWDDTIQALGLQFVGTRAVESGDLFPPDIKWWEGMVALMARFGIGSADAMIVNFFLNSKFPLLVTGDDDIVFVIAKLANNKKYVLCPSETEACQ